SEHSNAMAVSGKLTADGHPLLLGGPQTGYNVPQTWMEVGLHGAGYDATGVALAGTPGIEIGVAADGHGWSFTSAEDDNSDWYVEKIDPQGHPGQYFFDGKWKNYKCRPETINVSGGPSTTTQVCESVHGPVYATSGNEAFTVRYSTRENVAQSFVGFGLVAQASSIDAFGKALGNIAFGFNSIYADAAGNIAYWHAGHVPIRPATDNHWFPHPGDGSDEWLGYVPFGQMPQGRNPTQ